LNDIEKKLYKGILVDDSERAIYKFKGFGILGKEMIEMEEAGLKIALMPIYSRALRHIPPNLKWQGQT
jgi:hypothetical protein